MKRFTLLELLIVIAIIGILLTLLMPSLGKARYMSRKAVCASNMRQSGNGLLLSVKNNNGTFPDVQNHHQSAPYTTRVAYWTSTNKWYNLGKTYQEGYSSSAEAFYCPQNEENGTTKFTYGYNSDSDGEFDVHSGDYYIRVSYHLLPNYMTTNKRRSLKIAKLESDDLLMSELMTSQSVVAHKKYGVGWNIMKTDSSVKFKKSENAWAIIQAGSLGWDWNGMESVKEELLK